jgi:2-keto-4-pentenoate hydratase/2-oxohepta-3-ene-1,7-dioic acid hydratase in catechol pathway
MKIVCIGRNYVAHARELGNDVPAEPVFFLKPETALLPKRQPFFIPDFSNDVHYECELVLRIGRLGKHIRREFALEYIEAVGLGIDFTARDVQEDCKKKSLPWEKAKAFDGSAPVSEEFIPFVGLTPGNNISFSLQKNGETVQTGNSSLMIFDFAAIIEYVSKFVTLKIGDLIFTGTPAGVGKVEINDLLDGFIGTQKMFSLKIK